MPALAAVCLITFIHYVGAQMRGPVVPLYAVSNGATATGVGSIVASLVTVLIPHIHDQPILLSVVAVFVAVSGVAGVAMGVALAGAAAPAARGVVMGGYSTSLSAHSSPVFSGRLVTFDEGVRALSP